MSRAANTVALDCKSARNEAGYVPTTMTVNCTPFLTLFPRRLPAKDMALLVCYERKKSLDEERVDDDNEERTQKTRSGGTYEL